MTHFTFRQNPVKLLPYFMIYLIVMVGYRFIPFPVPEDTILTSTSAQMLPMLATLIQALVGLLFLAVLYQFVVEGLSAGDRKPVFLGALPLFLGRAVFGLVLSFITAGFYIPWYIRSIYAFFAENTYLDNESFRFHARPRRLLIVMITTFILPTLLIMIWFASLFAGPDPAQPMSFGATQIMMLLIYTAAIPFLYLYIRWIAQFSWKSYKTNLNVSAPEGIGYLLVQFLLTIVSLGLFAPAAVLRVIKFFAIRLELQSLDSSDADKRIEIGWDTKAGWWFIFKQVLLTAVTVGIYFPWGLCKVLEWMAPQIQIVSVDSRPVQDDVATAKDPEDQAPSGAAPSEEEERDPEQ